MTGNIMEHARHEEKDQSGRFSLLSLCAVLWFSVFFELIEKPAPSNPKALNPANVEDLPLFPL
jgi:hypothetical protein